MSEKTVILPITLSEEDADALRQAAKDNKTQMAHVVRTALAQYLGSSYKFTGKVTAKGGVRPGAGRPAKPPRQPQAS
jgi:hypothetical protein